MKKIKIAFSAVAIASMLFTTSCNEEYLDTTPTSSVGASTIYSSADNLMASINGISRMFYTRQNSSQGNNGYTAQLIITDVMGDDLIFPTTGNGWFVSELRWISQSNVTSGTVSYPWNFWYSIIKNTNNIITYGEEATGDQNLKDKAIGQAYAYRAFSYFQLVQLYGKAYSKGASSSDAGVVLRTDPSDVLPKGRSTVEETYAQIWADLDQAEKLLTGKSKTNNSHLALDNVLGLKARIALVQKDYTKAAQYAEMARKGKSLMSQAQYKAGFNDFTNPEWMWGIAIQADQTDYFGNFHAYMSRNFNSGQIRTAPKVMNVNLYNAFPDTDVRKQIVDKTGKHAGLGLPSNYSLFPYTSQKFLSESTSSALGDVPFMRVAEMYLIEAEAKYHLGNEAGSKVVLEQLVKSRDSEFKSITSTGAAYLEQILLNRRIELWGEGFRFFDLKRLGQGLNRRNANHDETVINSVYTIDANSPKWQWQIPQGELDSNPEITQNPS